MSRTRLIIIITMIAALQCPSWGAQKPVKPKPAAKPVPQVKVAPSGKIMLSPSVDYGSQAYNSWPLVLRVALWRELPVGKDVPKPITLKAKQGAWSEALVVQVKDSSGVPVKWPLHPVKQSEKSLTLGIDDTAEAEWWLAPEDTQKIPEGNYTISVSFDSKRLAEPINTGSDNYCLRVSKEPSPLNTDLKLDKQIELARLAMLKGDIAVASRIIDGVLAADPESIGGNRIKAVLLNREGKTREAVAVMDRALDSYHKKYPDACPPAGLLSERSEMLGKIKPKAVPE